MRAWLLVLGMLFVGCGGEETPPPPDTREALQGVEVEEHAGGSPAWRLRAREVVRRGDTLWLYPVTLAFLEQGDTVSFLRADSGWVLEASGRMTALGSVQVRTSTDTIFTRELAYDPARRRITSTAPSRILQPDRVIWSEGGFDTDPALEDIRFTGPVRIRSREAGS